VRASVHALLDGQIECLIDQKQTDEHFTVIHHPDPNRLTLSGTPARMIGQILSGIEMPCSETGGDACSFRMASDELVTILCSCNFILISWWKESQRTVVL